VTGTGRPPDPGSDLLTVAEELERARSRVRRFGLFMAALIIVTTLPLPMRLAGIAFAVATLWTAVQCLSTLATLHRLGVPVRGRIGVSIGLGVAGVLLAALLFQLAFYPLVEGYERCLGGANTSTAQHACEDQTKQRLQQLVDRVSGQLTG